MPSTFSPNLRLEIQATGENANTWGTKTNTNLDLLEKSVAGHRSISVAGSGTYTLSTANASEDEARYAFITLTGILTGNRTIIIPSQSKTYYFRNATTGSFTITVKTTPGSGVTLSTGISNVVCNGTDSYLAGTNTEYVDAAVSVLGAATSVQFAATSVQLAAVSAQVSINTAQIAAVSVLAQQAIVSAGDKVNKAGDNMTGFLTLHANPTSALHAATKQYVDGRLNRLINGDMRIDQRNAGAASTNTINGYFLDRWAVFQSVTGKLIAQQNAGSVTPPAGFTHYLGITSQSAYSVGPSDFYVIDQRVEGFNVSDLGWGTASARPVTLSFWARSSLTGTFGAALRNASENRSYPFTYTISAANTWEYKTVTIPGDTSGTWGTGNGIGIELLIGLGVGSAVSGTAGAWAGANLLGATGATSVVGTNSATFYLTGVQLEVGSVATPFERRQYGHELALCQRYYEVGYNIWSGYCNGSSTYNLNTGYKVTKRALATVSFSGISNSGFPNSAPTVAQNQVDSFRADLVSNSVSTAGFYQFNFAASAEL